MNKKSPIESPTRAISEYTMRFVVPRSCIIKYNAQIRLAPIRRKARAIRTDIWVEINQQNFKKAA
ncbi:Uncharacterized protein MCB1EB_2129 [Mycoavidus cysteinexigens]|uniref:Uncharacterized protein n=1 Tax=Mycoavidus cysteinexigens TaxID=1553431 RepID=A0A2Z6EXV8_9BURK|nr:Uncharacterized protein MCB1EB_2129 [Mycoavidus cysteinexigens]GAM53340.1 putative membrane protein [bacterium endosymbiont of Mortierella elongata FMR23-6]GLR00707.1 hypothetical protein GCM10007934_05180 [Mycoavidus cysteinexigens]